MNATHNALMELSNYELPPLVEFEEAPGLPGVISLGFMPESLRLPKVSDPYCNFACAHFEFGSSMFHFAKLSGLYVPLTLRRMGLGKALVYTAQEMAKARDVRLYVDAVPFGEHAIDIAHLHSFYLRMGFQPCRDHPFSMVYQPKGAAASA